VAADGSANAQAQPWFTRRILQKTEYPGDKYVCVLVEVEIKPNALVARHTHPGVESSYIASGTSTLSVKGQPDRVLKAGDGFQIPPEVPDSVRNGPTKSLVIANDTVEKDKPLASPAPEQQASTWTSARPASTSRAA
jgi:quercetin dioxygenase-like cupin family protein